MDTTKVEIIAKQIDKLVEAITHQNNSSTSPLFAAFIGGLIALIPLVFQYFLNNVKEKRALKYQLISKERSLAFLLEQSYQELVMPLKLIQK